MSHSLYGHLPLAVALEGDKPDGQLLVFRWKCCEIGIYYGNADKKIAPTRVNKNGGFDTVYSTYGSTNLRDAREHLLGCFSYEFMSYPGKAYHFPKTFRLLPQLPFEKETGEDDPIIMMLRYDELRKRDGDEILNVKNYRYEAVGYDYDRWYKVVCD